MYNENRVHNLIKDTLNKGPNDTSQFKELTIVLSLIFQAAVSVCSEGLSCVLLPLQAEESTAE